MTITEFLQDRGMRQKDLADALGVTAQHISAISTDRVDASLKLRYKFAEVFPGYDVDEFELTPEERAEWQRNRKGGNINSRFAIPTIELEPEPEPEAEKVEEEQKTEPEVIKPLKQELPSDPEALKVWTLLGRHSGMAMLFSSRDAAILHLGELTLDDEAQGYTLSELPVRG